MDNINDWRSSSSSCNYLNKIHVINSDEDQRMIIEDHDDLRRGPWTIEEDLTLINYISNHGEGRWNSLARCAGLKRTGKSCRLRWLNYLRSDVRRGNITLEEQLLILELHSRWGNRWSKIAQHLPGRTDNEIKNYWRTRVQKHAKQLKCDVNSKLFKDTMRCLWMPRLVERIQAATSSVVTIGDYSENVNFSPYFNTAINNNNVDLGQVHVSYMCNDYIGASEYDVALPPIIDGCTTRNSYTNGPENSTRTSSDSFGAQASSSVSNFTHNYKYDYHVDYNINPDVYFQLGSIDNGHDSVDFQALELNNRWTVDVDDAYVPEKALWSTEDIWLLQQQFNITI